METCASPFYCLTAAAHGLLVYVGVIAFAGVWQVLQSAPRGRIISAPTWGAVRIRRESCKSGMGLHGPPRVSTPTVERCIYGGLR